MNETKEHSSLDLMDVYLDQIGEHELLTREEEVELALILRAGTTAEETLKQADGLATKQIAELEIKVEAGDAAKEELIVSNLRLVVAKAREHQHRGLPLSDLIQEGYFGLIRAVEKFDPDKGFKFSTYAYKWIEQAIDRGVAASGKSFRISGDRNDTIATVETTLRIMVQKGNTKPTPAEISEASGVSEHNVKVALHMKYLLNTVSLSSPVGVDGATLQDFLPDEDIVVPDEHAISSEREEWLKQWLCSHLAGLTNQEQTLIRHLYGLGGNKKVSLSGAIKILDIRGKKRWEYARRLKADAEEKIQKSIVDETYARLRHGEDVDEEIIRMIEDSAKERLGEGALVLASQEN